MTPEDIELWLKYMNGEVIIKSISPSKLNAYRKLLYPLKPELDLHHYSVHEAYMIFNYFLECHMDAGTKVATIITGKSGKIRQEFPDWANLSKYVRSCKLEPNDGSFKIKIIGK